MASLKLLITIIATLALGATGIATVAPPSSIAANVDAALGRVSSTLGLETQAQVGTQRQVQNGKAGADVVTNGQTGQSAPKKKGNSLAAKTAVNANSNASANTVEPDNDSLKVATAIANEFTVAVNDVTALHDKGWGYGEIERLYEMARESGASVSLIESMRTGGKGWGETAKALNLSVSEAGKNLGAIISADGSSKFGNK